MRGRFQMWILLSVVWLGFVFVISEQAVRAQETQSAVVPRWINLSGTLKDPAGVPMTGMQSVTFSFYKNQQRVWNG